MGNMELHPSWTVGHALGLSGCSFSLDFPGHVINQASGNALSVLTIRLLNVVFVFYVVPFVLRIYAI